MSQMSLKNKIMKKVMINLSHNELDRRRRSNVCDISGTTLCPCSFSGIDFNPSTRKANLFCYKLETQNIFVLLNNSSRRVMIESMSDFNLM